MNVEDIISLEPEEEIIITYKCKFHTTQTALQEHIEQKRFMLVFEKNVTVQTPVEEAVELKGRLVLTNKRLIYVQSKGLIFGEDKVLLSAYYADIIGTSIAGLVFKKLIISIKNGKTIPYTFSDIPTEEAKTMIEKYTKQSESYEKKATTKKFCTKCGTELKKEDKFCNNCGKKL